ncbi:MAG: hypothetical protein KBC35_00290 [Candidatus Pacebacteria bacterium]|jgi:hypothetical protein|nr:hypothetical protein [Candidatus Paceibacterota bacterium]
MISRNQIESILKINGVNLGSPDEEIRSVLLSARYSKDEIDTAIMVLREDVKTRQTRVDGLHKVFRTGESLKPEEIAQLLGVEAGVEGTLVVLNKKRELTLTQLAVVWILSVIMATSGILISMYIHQVGVFYTASHTTSSQ